MTTATVPSQPWVYSLIALQFVAFGWRLNREIAVGDQQRRTWLPAVDWLNLISPVRSRIVLRGIAPRLRHRQSL